MVQNVSKSWHRRTEIVPLEIYYFESIKMHKLLGVMSFGIFSDNISYLIICNKKNSLSQSPYSPVVKEKMSLGNDRTRAICLLTGHKFTS